MEVRDKDEQEPVLIVERTEESSEESGRQTIPERNIQTEMQMAQKGDGNTEIMLRNVENLYKGLISNLNLEINFLKNQLLTNDTFFRDEIMFLRRQLSKALAKKVDISTYIFSSSVAVNVDEGTENEDPENSKHEKSVIRSNTKNINIKEKSNMDSKVNSNTNNNVGRQRRETEKKSENHLRMIQQNTAIRKINIKVRKS